MGNAPIPRRSLPVVSNDASRAVGAAGVVLCTLCCLSIPGIASVLSAVGLSFLRNDRILFPGTAIFAGLVIVTFARSYARHHRLAPLLSGLAAVATVLTGLRIGGAAATALVTGGVAVLLAAVIWDSRLQRRCGG